MNPWLVLSPTYIEVNGYGAVFCLTRLDGLRQHHWCIGWWCCGMFIAHMNELRGHMVDLAPRTAPTLGCTMNLITSFTMAQFLVASLPALNRFWKPIIATGLKKRPMPRSRSPRPAPYWYLEVPLNMGNSKFCPCWVKAAFYNLILGSISWIL